MFSHSLCFSRSRLITVFKSRASFHHQNGVFHSLTSAKQRLQIPGLCTRKLAAFYSSDSATKKTLIAKHGPKFQTPSRKRLVDDQQIGKLDWNVWAYATADEYRMADLGSFVQQTNVYQINLVAKDLPDVFRLTPVYLISGNEDRREIFVFSEGAVVFWNVPLLERQEFLCRLKPFEKGSVERILVEQECERIVHVVQNYSRENDDDADANPRRARFRQEILYLDSLTDESHTQLLERYTVSNVMAASVKLSIWEADFDDLASSLEDVTIAMREGRIHIRKRAAISYAGRLSTLRHNINLYSDLLDYPDFYWERVGLERLYDQASEILCIRRRVQVVNKKLDDAMALVQLIVNQLATMHSARLEWLIIWLIMIEVLFESYHFFRN